MTRQVFLFLLVGGISALINFSSRIFYSLWIGYSAAIVFAYVTGMVFAYFLFSIFVFKVQRQYTFRSGAYFILVNLVGILQAWFISVGLVNYLFPILEFDFYNLEIAHSIGILVPAFTSYFGHKWLSFS